MLLAACAARGPLLTQHLDGAATERPVELADTPFFPQVDYQCGPAALATVLNESGREVDLQALVPQVYVPARKGSLQIEIVAAARRHGRLPYRIDPDMESLLAELRAGRPVLVFQNLGIRLLPVWHYAVVVGYHPGDDTIVLRSGTERRRVMAAADFLETWERGGKWAVVVLAPGEMPVEPGRDRYLSAASAMARANPPGVVTRLMRAAAEQWPDDALVRFALGNALYDQGLRREALRAFRRALSLDPGLLAARNNLAHGLAELGCRDQGLAELERALAHAPRNGGMRQTLLQTRSEIVSQRQNDGAAATGACP